MPYTIYFICLLCFKSLNTELSHQRLEICGVLPNDLGRLGTDLFIYF